MPSVDRPNSRLAFLDWTRGLAAIIMLQGHVFHSFTRQELRSSGPYVFSQFIGGMPPALFLFLTGMTLAFLMESRERKGFAANARVLSGLRRAGYLFMLAFLFRLQLWLFGLPGSRWTDLLRVDILNCMGLAIGLMSVMAVFRAADRVRICAAIGLVIAAASPLVSQLDWTGVPAVVRSYLAPDYQFFGFFPWGSFVAFGMSAGSIVRLLRKEQMDHAMQWAAFLGFGLVLGGQYLSSLPFSVYPKSEFWLDSPWLILIKLGVILLMVAAAYLWTQYGARNRWSWVQQFGTTSLLVYWVHTELVYGRWLYFWKGNLSNGQTFLAAVAVILLMLVLAATKTQWKGLAALRPSPGYRFLVPRRVPAD
jgi:uncharacterized membrane protein